MNPRYADEVVIAMDSAQAALSKLAVELYGYDDDLDNEIDRLYMKIAAVKLAYKRATMAKEQA